MIPLTETEIKNLENGDIVCYKTNNGIIDPNAKVIDITYTTIEIEIAHHCGSAKILVNHQLIFYHLVLHTIYVCITIININIFNKKKG